MDLIGAHFDLVATMIPSATELPRVLQVQQQCSLERAVASRAMSDHTSWVIFLRAASSAEQ
jgi:hypothetical protein